MPVGELLPGAIHRDSSGINPDLDVTKTVPSYPTALYVGSVGIAGTITDNQPISEPARSKAGEKLPSYLDDYYYRTHILPRTVSGGNLLGVVVETFEVWNAYFVTQALNAVNETDVDGVTLSGQPAAPTTFQPLESRIYTLTFGLDAGPTVDGNFAFDFALYDAVLYVTGQRVVPWPFMAQSQFKESLEFKTNIIEAYSAEQRIALTDAPRQRISQDFLLNPDEFSKAKALGLGWTNQEFGLPIWHESELVGALSASAGTIALSTDNKDFRAGDLAFVWESNSLFEAVTVESFTSSLLTLDGALANSYTNAYVCPMRIGRFINGVDFKRGAYTDVLASLEFESTVNTDLSAASSYDTYKTRDVINVRSVISDTLTEKTIFKADVIDNGFGSIALESMRDWFNHNQFVTFSPQNLAELWAVREFIHSRRGKQKSFWLPSWNVDLVLIDGHASITGTLIINSIAYPNYFGQRDIAIYYTNGTVSYNTVLSGTTNLDGDDVLVLETALASVDPATIDHISFMSLVRFASDKVTINHDYAGSAYIQVPVTEVPAQ